MQSKVEIAYMAGLVDGEGTITVLRRKQQLDTPVVQVVSTDLEMLKWIKDRWGGCISKKKVYKDHHRQSWSWEIRGGGAVRLLIQIEPFLLVPRKRERTRLLAKDYFRLTPRNGYYVNDQRDQRRELLASVMEVI